MNAFLKEFRYAETSNEYWALEIRRSFLFGRTTAILNRCCGKPMLRVRVVRFIRKPGHSHITHKETLISSFYCDCCDNSSDIFATAKDQLLIWVLNEG